MRVKLMSDRLFMLKAIVIIIALFPVYSNAQENQKLAQTGFQYLSVPTNARASAMGEATTTISMGSNSLFFNPAGMARGENFTDASFGQNQWIADIVYNSFSISLASFRNRRTGGVTPRLPVR